MSTWNIFITLSLWTLVSGAKKERTFQRELVSEDLDVLASYQAYRSSLECATKFGQERHKNGDCLAYSFDPESRTCLFYKIGGTNPSQMSNMVLYKFVGGPFCNTSHGFHQVWADDQMFCYAYMNLKKSYHGALRHCLKLRAHLLTFDKVMETKAVKSFHKGYFWVGATDIAEEGRWVCVKDGKPITSDLWPPWWYQTREPSNKPGEDCLFVWRGSFSFNLFDDKCYKRRHYICERTT